MRPTRPNRLKQLAGRQNSIPWPPPSEGFRLLKSNRRRHCQAAAPHHPFRGAAGRDCPPARNCPRRLAPVGPDSTLPAPKKQFFSLRQCPWSNVAALSGPYGRLAPSFSGRRTSLPGGRRRYGLRQAFCSTFRYLKLSGVARRRFQSTEGQQKTALPSRRLPPPPLPEAAGQDCPADAGGTVFVEYSALLSAI